MLIAFIHQIRRDLRSPSPKIRGAAASFFRGDAKKNLTLQAISMIAGRTPQWIREKIKTGGILDQSGIEQEDEKAEKIAGIEKKIKDLQGEVEKLRGREDD